MDALLSDLSQQEQHARLQRVPDPVLVDTHRVITSGQWVNEFTASGFQSQAAGTSKQSSIRSQSLQNHPYHLYTPRPFLLNQTVQPVRQLDLNSQSTSDVLPQPFLQKEEEKLTQEKQSHEQRKAEEFVSFVEELQYGADKVDTETAKQSEQKDDLAFWQMLADDWNQAAKEDESAYNWLGDYETVTDPFKDGYFFKDDNPLKEVPNAFQEGLKKLEEGDIPSAVLLFEAACQQEPENQMAWQYLGTTQAKNEHDPAAIRALKRALELDPKNLTTLMALAVSYTNESYQKLACDCLAQWIRNNEAYADCTQVFANEPSAKDTSDHPFIVSSVASTQHFNNTKEAFIHAARKLPQNLDPDVQCGLGVLFNLSGEYDKAVDCFKAALAAKPDDALLWNRLGATLANGSRSEEAIDAYRRALNISPGFVRCRFNLGVSCINLNSYREAAEHFLTVLNFQNAGRGPANSNTRTAMSANVWNTMRMVLSLLNRQDLYEAVESRDLNRLNREFGIGN